MEAHFSSSLRITEIFYSIQGESSFSGIPTVFIRLTGCPLRCQYCDTVYAFTGGTKMIVSDILQTVRRYKTRYVTVTGGEPLAQPQCIDLLAVLCAEDYVVSLETSGAMDIAHVPSAIIKILDLKTPGSGEERKNLYSNLEYLSTYDEIKFVICDQADYGWAKSKIDELGLIDRCQILFSPSYNQLEPKILANWIIEDQLPVKLQIQLHKYLWGDIPGC